MYRAMVAGFLFWLSPLYAFDCYLSLVKNSCWANYNVTVTLLDADTNKTITTLDMPKGTMWNRQYFACEPKMKLNYTAVFSPTIWENEKPRAYTATRFWSLPETIKAGTSAWEVPICYPNAFSEVPLPPEANNTCQCDFKQLPAIKPKIIDKTPAP